MGKPRSLTPAWIALGASVLFVAGSAAHYLNRRFASTPPAPAPSTAPPATGLPSQADVEPATAEGRATVKVASLLSSLRRPGIAKAEADAIEREARTLSASLVEDLRRNPRSWKEVMDLATSTEDLKVALRLASLLGGAGDGSAEALWVERLSGGAVRRRHVAATALAGAASAGSLHALAEAADRDGDTAVRLAAITSLAQRRLGAAPERAAAIEQALRRRAESDAAPHVRDAARNLLAPMPPPGLRPPPRK